MTNDSNRLPMTLRVHESLKRRIEAVARAYSIAHPESKATVQSISESILSGRFTLEEKERELRIHKGKV